MPQEQTLHPRKSQIEQMPAFPEHPEAIEEAIDSFPSAAVDFEDKNKEIDTTHSFLKERRLTESMESAVKHLNTWLRSATESQLPVSEDKPEMKQPVQSLRSHISNDEKTIVEEKTVESESVRDVEKSRSRVEPSNSGLVKLEIPDLFSI